jgi:nitrite reductase/ring-hydroxylating ferredoxin subunit
VTLTVGPPNRLPNEGDDGLFTESWFPVCLSSEVSAGRVIGRDFLDGRVAVFREAGGAAHVLSSYCPHLGADLACGSVVGANLRCAFHHWEFSGRGECVRTAVGDPAPGAARLFEFPVRERWGIVFAFNGLKASWELPDFEFPDDELYVTTQVFPEIACDPWVICCNTSDVQHLKVLHKIRMAEGSPKRATYSSSSMGYHFEGWHPNGDPLDWHVSIHGTSLFFQQGTFNGVWLGVTTPLGMPRPGRTHVYAVIAVRLDDKSPEALAKAQVIAEMFRKIENNILFEDIAILQRIRFRPGTLTKSDRALAEFLDYLRAYPRSHHSADFIR